MGLFDIRHINKEITDFGDTVKVRAVTKLDYDLRGNAQLVFGDSKISYLTGDDTNSACYDTNYIAQTFTIGTADIDISSIKLKVKRTGTCGTMTVGLYAVDVNNKPTGTALDTESLDYSDMLDDGDTEWVTFPINYTASASTTYAIVVSSTGADVSNKYDIRTVTTGAYSGGNILTSDDSGSTWTAGTLDILFNILGDTSTIAMVDVLTQEDEAVATGVFQSGDKRFTFKNTESNIVRGTRLYHKTKWYQVDVLENESLEDVGLWLSTLARKI